MYKHRLLDDWERVTSVLSEDPDGVPVEALDMVEPDPGYRRELNPEVSSRSPCSRFVLWIT
jgi:hypothetical protein